MDRDKGQRHSSFPSCNSAVDYTLCRSAFRVLSNNPESGCTKCFIGLNLGEGSRSCFVPLIATMEGTTQTETPAFQIPIRNDKSA